MYMNRVTSGFDMHMDNGRTGWTHRLKHQDQALYIRVQTKREIYESLSKENYKEDMPEFSINASKLTQ